MLGPGLHCASESWVRLGSALALKERRTESNTEVKEHTFDLSAHWSQDGD